MKTKFMLGVLTALASVSLLSGCVIAFGNRVPDDRKATLGKQITDLKQARDSGALTEEEYQTAKQRLIEGK
jgi:hypothetical protein